MVTRASAVELRQRLGEMLNQVQLRRDSIVIDKDGREVAALIDARLFGRIRAMRTRFDELSTRIASAYAAVPPTEGLAEIDAAARTVRAESRRRSAHLAPR